MIPREGQPHGGIPSGVRLAGFLVHRGGAGQQLVNVDSLQGRRNQAYGGQHRGPAADPVFHRKPRDELVLRGELSELRALAGDGHGMFAEVQPGGGVGGLRL